MPEKNTQQTISAIATLKLYSPKSSTLPSLVMTICPVISRTAPSALSAMLRTSAAFKAGPRIRQRG